MHLEEPLTLISKFVRRGGGFWNVVLVYPSASPAPGKHTLQEKRLVFDIFDGDVLNQFTSAGRQLATPFVISGETAVQDLYNSSLSREEKVVAARSNADFKFVRQATKNCLVAIFNILVSVEKLLQLLRPGNTRLYGEAFVHDPQRDIDELVDHLERADIKRYIKKTLKFCKEAMGDFINCGICVSSCFAPGVGLVMPNCGHNVCRKCQSVFKNRPSLKGLCPYCKTLMVETLIPVNEIPPTEYYFDKVRACELCSLKEEGHECKFVNPCPIAFNMRHSKMQLTNLTSRTSGYISGYGRFRIEPHQLKQAMLMFSSNGSGSHRVHVDAMYKLRDPPETVEVLIEKTDFTSIKIRVPFYNSLLAELDEREFLERKGTYVDSRWLSYVSKFVCEDVGNERDLKQEEAYAVSMAGSYKKSDTSDIVEKLYKNFEMKIIQRALLKVYGPV